MYQEVFGQGFDSPRVHQNKKEASCLFFVLRDLIKGVERSEQNNPVSCFVNGDRRILRDVTKNQIQSIEQNSRTTPLGSTKIQKGGFAPPFCILTTRCSRAPSHFSANRGSHSALKDRQARLSGVECRNIRRRHNSP